MACCDYLPATFRKRLTLQAKGQPVSDGQGGREETWDDVATVSASLDPVKSYERYQAMQMQTPVSHKIVMRYRPDVTTASRFRLGDRIFWVKEVINQGEQNRYLTIKAIERA